MKQTKRSAIRRMPGGTTLGALLGLLLLGGSGTRAGEPAAFAAAGPYPVGVRTVIVVDDERVDEYAGGPRTLVTEVWYPAVDESRGTRKTTFFEFFGRGREAAERFVRRFGGTPAAVDARFRSLAARDVPLQRGRYPLLVFSHGNGGVRHQNTFQLDHLASHGYVILSPDHTGNAGVTVLPEKVLPYDRKGRDRSAEDRPLDVRRLIDWSLQENRREGSWLEGAIDAQAIGVLGHSFGGYTSCQVALIDARVRAILPMTLAFSDATRVPTMLMLAGEDGTVGTAGNLLSGSYYVRCTGPKYMLTLLRGGHFSFTDMDCINPAFGDGIGSEERDGKQIDYLASDLAKEIVNVYSLAFFDAHLRANNEARAFLEENAYPEEIRYQKEKARERAF